jgi:hypothetical protein
MSSHIDDYRFGRIVIDGRPYTSDVIVYSGRVEDSWWRKRGHALCLEDIAEVLQRKPEVLVIGTGSAGIMRVDRSVVEEIEKRGIEVVIDRTAPACRTFNRLLPRKDVAGAFHLTC